ncbi:MAG: peroxiredoxin family protein, partial [Planctomycetaceae bacterium]|nr:peroxiredoxin family protein [Planctomycetaceae bacterium]
EWLIRNLGHLGRAHDAVRLANHLLDLPRHPELNSLSKSGSCAALGKQRLIDTLTRFEMWDELLAADERGRFEWSASVDDQVKRARLLGAACFGRGDVARGKEQIAALEALLAAEAEPEAPPAVTPPAPPSPEPTATADATAPAVPAAPAAAATPAESAAPAPTAAATGASAPPENATGAAATADAPPPATAPAPSQPAEAAAPPPPAAVAKPTPEEAEKTKAAEAAKRERQRKRKQIETALAELRCYLALAEDRSSDALEQLKHVGDLSKSQRALVQRAAKDLATAETLAREAWEADRQQAQPLAVYVDVLAAAGKTDEAVKQFETLRTLAGQADLDLPAFRRVTAWAETRDVRGDWRVPYAPPADVGERPALESLGPLFYHPWSAPSWSLPDAAGNELSLAQFAGKPVVVIFYLGIGCLHCVEQLQSFAPLAKDFRAAGIELVAISTDSRDVLGQSLEKFKQSDGTPFPIPLAANPLLDVFKNYRIYDDFESQPLHGTFLIDGQGVIRWQEISYQPFNQPKFLLEEATRLLRQPRE